MNPSFEVTTTSESELMQAHSDDNSTASLIFIWTVSIFFSSVLISGVICIFRTFFYHPAADAVEPLFHGHGFFPGQYRGSRISENIHIPGQHNGLPRKSSGMSKSSTSSSGKSSGICVVEVNGTSGSPLEGYQSIGSSSSALNASDRPGPSHSLNF